MSSGAGPTITSKTRGCMLRQGIGGIRQRLLTIGGIRQRLLMLLLLLLTCDKLELCHTSLSRVFTLAVFSRSFFLMQLINVTISDIST